MPNKIYISNKQKQAEIPSGTRLLIRRCCNAVLETEGFDEGAEISVSFVSNDEIRKLNREYRNIDSPTDVLSFPFSNEKGEFEKNEDTGLYVIGDVVISMEKAVEQSVMFGHSLQREVAYLVVHSMFHLMGYDHADGGIEQVRMREREELVMRKLGLPRGTTYILDEV